MSDIFTEIANLQHKKEILENDWFRPNRYDGHGYAVDVDTLELYKVSCAGVTEEEMSKNKHWFRKRKHAESYAYTLRQLRGVLKLPTPEEDVNKEDPIDNPSHYTSGGIETIDYIKAKLTKEEFAGYCKGNVIKYISRAGKKSDAGLEDYKKASVYLNWLIVRES